LFGLVETPYHSQVPIDLDLLSILQPGRGVEYAGHAGFAIFAGNERTMLQGAADLFMPSLYRYRSGSENQGVALLTYRSSFDWARLPSQMDTAW
jgi:hypothetical protein